jgi:antitoxin HigA-1
MTELLEKTTPPKAPVRLRNPHPGDIIREDFLIPWQMTAYRLAQGTGMSRTRISQILRGKRAITAETALRLSRFLGCTPEFWLGLQMSYDLREAQARAELAAELDQITPYQHTGPLLLDGELVEQDSDPPAEEG